jgi:hypothetical protein
MNDTSGACDERDGSHAYQIQFALDNLDFRLIEIADPVPLGRQILSVGGLNPQGDYGLVIILPSGDFEDIRLDESFDLRGHSTAQFVAFHTDRNFKFTLNNRELTWGKPVIKGSDIYKLANDDQAIFLEIRGGTDKLIAPDEMIDLTASGIEHFITAPYPSYEIEIIVNARPKIVTNPNVTYEQIVELAWEHPTYAVSICT